MGEWRFAHHLRDNTELSRGYNDNESSTEDGKCLNWSKN